MISAREVVRGTVLRFLPAVAVGAVSIMLLLDGRAMFGLRPAAWLGLGGMLAAQALGYGVALFLARYRLRADAQVDGRRGVLSGALGITLLLAASVASQGLGAPWRVILTIGSGIIAAMAMYWPWLRQRPSEQQLAVWEAADVAALGVAAMDAPPRPLQQHDRAV